MATAYRALRKRRHQDDEFADEQPEGRHAGHRQAADDQHAAGVGQGTRHAANAVHAQGSEGFTNVARGKEQQRLGERVVESVQQRAVKSERTAQANSEGNDSHMFNAAVGQQAFQVALHNHQERGDDYR